MLLKHPVNSRGNFEGVEWLVRSLFIHIAQQRDFLFCLVGFGVKSACMQTLALSFAS